MNDVYALHSPVSDRRFTVEDLAERWHCSIDTVRANRQRWGLKGMRFGKRYLFTLEEVLAAEKRQAKAR